MTDPAEHGNPRDGRASWPEVFASTAAVTDRVSRDVAAGRLRSLGLRLYTPNLHDDPDWSSYATAEPVLRATRAFDRPGSDVRLLLPRAV